MKLNVRELELLIYVLGVRLSDREETALMIKLGVMKEHIKEETNELEAEEN
jgi:hypothetical protein